MSMSTVNRDAVLRAFKNLRKRGYKARANFMCCGGCACAELSACEPRPEKVIYWHRQDEQSAFPKDKGNRYRHRSQHAYSLWLGWAGDKEEIANALMDQGLVVVIPESEATRFEILPAQLEVI